MRFSRVPNGNYDVPLIFFSEFFSLLKIFKYSHGLNPAEVSVYILYLTINGCPTSIAVGYFTALGYRISSLFDHTVDLFNILFIYVVDTVSTTIFDEELLFYSDGRWNTMV